MGTYPSQLLEILRILGKNPEQTRGGVQNKKFLKFKKKRAARRQPFFSQYKRT